MYQKIPKKYVWQSLVKTLVKKVGHINRVPVIMAGQSLLNQRKDNTMKQYVKAWEHKYLSFPGDKPVYGEITDQGLIIYLDLDFIKTSEGADQIMVKKDLEPKSFNTGSLVVPQVIKHYKDQTECIKAFVKSSKKLQAKLKKEINK